MNIGIMGGTFNPIHIGHLIAAEEVLNNLNLDNILFIPSGNPPHKEENKIETSEHRLQMVKLAISKNNRFSVSDMEIKRVGKTYTYDTLVELHKIYYGNQLYFIIGYDTLKELYTWKSIEDVCRLCSFVVVNRSSNKDDMNKEIFKIKKKYAADILVVDIPNIEISSTDIRKRLLSGKSIRYLVSENVDEYINKNGLYKGV